jgi:archaellum component FlaF (FlaF/FlaG flagellin family)
MRYKQAIGWRAFVLAAVFTFNHSHAQNVGSAVSKQNVGDYAVTERGADYNVHQRTTLEHGTNRVHQYTELATGLNYQKNGQWIESKEEIDILPNGTAVATNGQHQAYFPGNIYNGTIQVVTPDGLTLKSRPLALSYDDGNNTVLIAVLTNSTGFVVGSNQVIYPNAFTDFKADLRYTYKKGGFEQDIVLQEQPPAPEAYGMSSRNTRLQVLTEFFNAPEPGQLKGKASRKDGLADTTLTFGNMAMVQGKAFAINSQGGNRKAATRASPVYKSWQKIQGRTFLMEELPVANLAAQLDQLPAPASSGTTTPRPSGPLINRISLPRGLPPVRLAEADQNTIRLARADMNYKTGVVLDYDEEDAGDLTDFTFQAGTTYYISGGLNLYGTTTFSGTAVIKEDELFGSLGIYGYVNSATDPADPAIFTSANDDSLGETIDGSTGNPSQCMNNMINAFTDSIELDNFQINYSECAFFSYNHNSTSIFWNCEFNNCQWPNIAVDSGEVVLRNVLNPTVYFCGVDYGWATDGDWYALDAQQVTSVGQGGSFLYGASGSYSIKNSIIMGEDGDWESTGSLEDVVTSGVTFASDGTNNYFLPADSPYHGAGATDIDGYLLSEFWTLTTYAPQDGSWPNIGTPDLGYHYPSAVLNVDSDGDGLPDWWELYWFGNLNYTGSEVDGNGNTLLYDYQNRITPNNVDSDNDGLPDWWELYWFGNLNQNGSTLDSNGNTLLYDYQNGLEPANVISFTIEVANNYVNTSYPALQLNVASGVPGYYAVLVDGTNYAAATWATYTSSNITVNVGSTQGWHDIWVGLRGYTDSTIAGVWHWKGLKLDTTPPSLTITSPTNGTVNVPLIQLMGYSPEALGSISYDLTNALGLVTNQQVLVLDQFYSTNTWEFTTNKFQAFDVALTNGVNTIILHATDLAGNATTLTTNFTLNYTTATNPVVSLTWPTNGMQLCGSSFTLRGTVDDPTASITAQITSTNATNIIIGEVERTGVLWVENLPLAEGTNWLALSVTNSAGFSSVTNIALVKNDMALMLTNIDGSLWQPPVNVSGLISDTSASVSVNGVAGMNNGDGTWSASNVPVSTSGVASFDMKASSSGGGNPAASTTTNKPTRLYMEKYIESDGGNALDDGTDGYDYLFDRDSSYHWDDGIGGGGSSKNDYDWIGDTWWHQVQQINQLSSPASFWPALAEGTNNFTEVIADSSYATVTNVTAPTWTPAVDSEHCAVKTTVDAATGLGPASWGGALFDDNYSGPYHRTADATWKLQTGGKASIKRQNLWCLSGTASEMLDLVAQAQWSGSSVVLAGTQDPEPTQAIPPQSIEIMKQALGSDGNLWITLPDGDTPIDVTPIVKKKDFYTFTVGAQEYHCYFTAYAEEPNPGGGRHSIISLTKFFAGHGWWCLSSDAPLIGLNKAGISIASLAFLNDQVGYFPLVSLSSLFDPEPGVLENPGGASTINAQRTFDVGFNGLKSGLDFTANLSSNPGTYSLYAWPHNCVTTTVQAGAAAGVTLPNDTTPQNLGIDLNAMPNP